MGLIALTGCESRNPYAGIAASLPTGSASISPEGLVAAYDMETMTGDGALQDLSGNANHGMVRLRTPIEGLHGDAWLFSTVADRIDLPEASSFDLSGPLTVAVWVRITTLDLHQHIFACDDRFALWVTPQNQFRLGDTQGNGYSTEAGGIEPGVWYSVVGVLRGTAGDSLTRDNIDVFVNGESTAGTADPTWSSTVLHPEDACHIGFESHQGNTRHQALQFEGAIDEVSVFSRALTLREVRAHANLRPDG